MTPECSLVASIISQAYSDMLGPNDIHAFPAISFLTTRYGDHAQWRNQLCSLVGLDGQALAQRIVKGLEGETELRALFYEDASHRHEQSVERARKRWQHLKSRHTPPASSV